MPISIKLNSQTPGLCARIRSHICQRGNVRFSKADPKSGKSAAHPNVALPIHLGGGAFELSTTSIPSRLTACLRTSVQLRPNRSKVWRATASDLSEFICIVQCYSETDSEANRLANRVVSSQFGT